MANQARPAHLVPASSLSSSRLYKKRECAHAHAHARRRTSASHIAITITILFTTHSTLLRLFASHRALQVELSKSLIALHH